MKITQWVITRKMYMTTQIPWVLILLISMILFTSSHGNHNFKIHIKNHVSPQSHLLISLEHAYTLVKCRSFISTLKIIENRIAEQSTIKLNRKWLSVKQITKPGEKQKKTKTNTAQKIVLHSCHKTEDCTFSPNIAAPDWLNKLLLRSKSYKKTLCN